MAEKHVPRKLAAWSCFFFVFFLFAFLVIIPSISLALDCNNPPRGFGGSWARAYKNWCESCGGTYSSSGPSCIPGTNWGGRQQSPSYQPQQPSYDYGAERQRQLEAEQQRRQELEDQRKRGEEEARKRQEEFERSKQDALKSMKGISENELGLKGLDSGGDLGLKGVGDTGTGSLGLKGLEHNKAAPGKSNKEFKAKAEKEQEVWQKALGCVMEDVYARADSQGSVGVKFSKDLRKEMKKVFNKAGKPVKDKDSEKIVSLFLDRPTVNGDFIVSIAVHSKDNSNVEIDVQSYFSESKGKKDKRENLQTILILDKYGKVIEGHESASATVNACLAR